MNVKNLFIMNAVVTLLFGLALALVPRQITDLYDFNLNDGGLLTARFFSAALLGVSTLTWLVRDLQPSDARQAILLALFVEHAVGLLVGLIAQLNGILNGLGWTTVAIYFIFALAYGYFRFMVSEEGMAQASPSM